MKLRLLLPLLLACATAAQAQDIHVEFSNPALRILQSYTLHQGETAQQVVVIGGDATIEGEVDGDVVVILGEARLGRTAVIEGSFITVAGSAAIAEGARVHGDVVTIGGFDAAPRFTPGGTQVVIGTAGLGTSLRHLLPWMTRGLLFGRLIVPDLAWVWAVAAAFFLLNLLLELLFDRPISACAAALRATPLSAFVTGLLVMLLAGPLCALLAVSVIGIAVIPFLVCALALGFVIGRIAFARWLGMAAVYQADLDNRAQSLRSFVIGSAIMCVAYMIPVLGVLTWAMAAVFGLGAATQAFVRAYRRENPRPRRKTGAATAAPVVTAPATLAVAAPVEGERATAHAAVAAVDDGSLSPPMADSFSAEAAAPQIERPMPPGGLLGRPHAAFADRLAALCLDIVLIAIVAQVLRLDRLFSDYPLGEHNFLLLALVYHVGFWAWKQTTVGGIICQLRLVRVDGGRVGFAEALVRGLTGIFSLIVAGLGFLWILRDPERQAWHDRVAGTYVVKVPRDWPI
ncbi:MAG TPA: RDD family protein [Vicinamibacterales bacterium]|nr:RDD family protein [Vicinamibacterales bacterium]